MTQYILIKRGMYYRPEAKGYTRSFLDAGLFNTDEALSRARVPGVLMKSIDQCLADIDGERRTIRQRLDALDKHERHVLGLRVDG